MRYIADESGCLKEVSFGAIIVCGGQECVAYTGGVPAGYSSLVDWYMQECDKLHRWKIVDGELVLDDTATAPEADYVCPKITFGTEEPTDGENGDIYFRTGGDAVVEVGTSGIWTYRKWASGIAECWGSKTYTAAITSASGSNYYAKLDSPENYPFTFAAVPQQFVTLQSGPYAAWLEINASSGSWPSTTSTGYQMLVSPTSRESGDYTVAYNVIGRWK